MTSFAPGPWGIPVVQSNADRGTLFPGPALNQRVHNLTSGAIERWNGTAWVSDFFANPKAWINVADYGAVGGNVALDTAGFAAAMAVAPVNGVLYVPRPANPSNVYLLTSLPKIAKSMTILGADTQVSIMASGLTTGQYLLDIDGSISPNLDFVQIENLTLMSDNNAPDLVRVNSASEVLFRNVILRNCRHGITLTGGRTFSLQFDRVMGSTAVSGNCINYTYYTGGGHHTFLGCSLNGNIGCNVDNQSQVGGMSFHSSNFEACLSNGFAAQGTVNGLAFHGCRWEKCAVSDISLVPASASDRVSGLAVSGCFFNTNGTSYSINLGGGSGKVRGFAITGNYADFYTSAFVRLNGDGQSGIIAGNKLNTVPAIINGIRSGVAVFNNENDTGPLGQVWTTPLQHISADRGDASVTLSYGNDAEVQTFATTLTANRTVTLPPAGNSGGTYRIVRTGLGAFTLAVGSLKTIPSGTAAFVDVSDNGTAWVLTGYGTL